MAITKLAVRALQEDDPDAIADLQQGIAILARAVAIQHRMSDRQADQLADSIARVLEQVGGQLGIEPNPV